MNGSGRRKILFVIDSFNIGGAERSLCTLLGLLPAEKFDISVMLTSGGGPLEKYLPPDVRLSEIPLCADDLKSRLRFRFHHLRHALISRMARQRNLRSNPVELYWTEMGCLAPAPAESYDVAIAYHQGFPTYFVAEKVKAARKIAWINADIVRDNYSEAFNLRFYHLYNKVVTASARLRDLLLDAWHFRPEQLLPIRDIVSSALLRRLAGGDDSAPGQHSGPLRLLTVGRLAPVKGYDLLIATAALLRDRGFSFRWDIIGDGPMREEIRRLISRHSMEEHVTLLGPIDNPYPWMRSCDIYIQPSRSEGYGIAVCEAKAFCRPVIVTDFKVAPELIDHGRDGLIASMTAESLADAVTRLASPQLREKISSRIAASDSDDTSESLRLVLELLD